MFITMHNYEIGVVCARIVDEYTIGVMAFNNFCTRKSRNEPGSDLDDWLKAETEYRQKLERMHRRVAIRAHQYFQSRESRGLSGSADEDWLKAEYNELGVISF